MAFVNNVALQLRQYIFRVFSYSNEGGSGIVILRFLVAFATQCILQTVIVSHLLQTCGISMKKLFLDM